MRESLMIFVNDSRRHNYSQPYGWNWVSAYITSSNVHIRCRRWLFLVFPIDGEPEPKSSMQCNTHYTYAMLINIDFLSRWHRNNSEPCIEAYKSCTIIGSYILWFFFKKSKYKIRWIWCWDILSHPSDRDVMPQLLKCIFVHWQLARMKYTWSFVASTI